MFTTRGNIIPRRKASHADTTSDDSQYQTEKWFRNGHLNTVKMKQNCLENYSGPAVIRKHTALANPDLLRKLPVVLNVSVLQPMLIMILNLLQVQVLA